MKNNDAALKLIKEMIQEEIENMDSKKHEDHEGTMARGEVRQLVKNSISLHALLQDKEELPGWVSAYITLASDYINSVNQYMTEQEHEEDEEGEENEEVHQ